MSDVPHWDVIAVSSGNDAHTLALCNHWKALQSSHKSVHPQTIILGICDPHGAHVRIGSGGALFNCLLVVAEHLSAHAGDTFVNSRRLEGKRILLLFADFETQRIPAFSSSSSFTGGEICNVFASSFASFKRMNELRMAQEEDCPGVWVCNTGGYVHWEPEEIPIITNSHVKHKGMTMVTFAVPSEYVIERHGALKVDPESGEILDMKYRPTADELTSAGYLLGDKHDASSASSSRVFVVSGIIILSTETAQLLTDLHASDPFTAVTYLGADYGNTAIPFSIALDIFGALGKDAERERFMRPLPGTVWGDRSLEEAQSIRSALWDILRPKVAAFAASSKKLGDRCAYEFIKSTHEYMATIRLLPQSPECGDEGNPGAFRSLESAGVFTSWSVVGEGVGREESKDAEAEPDSVPIVINSLLEGAGVVGGGSIIEHCHLQGKWRVRSGAISSGITRIRNASIPARISIQQLSISCDKGSDMYVFIFSGLDDDWNAPAYVSGATFCNRRWADFSTRAGRSIEKILWPETPQQSRTLYNAKLFPVLNASRKDEAMVQFASSHALWFLNEKATRVDAYTWSQAERLSLKEVFDRCNILQLAAERGLVAANVTACLARRVLTGRQNVCLRPLYRNCSASLYAGSRDPLQGVNVVLRVLDEIASTTDDDVAARALAHISDVLAIAAGSSGGLRSGPAQNRKWVKAIALLRVNRAQGVHALAGIRKHWMSDPVKLIRAARHYEGAAQVLIESAVKSSSQFITTKVGQPAPIGAWVCVASPSRIDLAGGWTDTPPITYECGGKVANIAVLLDEKFPIGCDTRRIQSYELRFVLARCSREEKRIHPEKAKEIVTCVTSLSGMMDYCVPTASAALLKASLICMGVVDVRSDATLEQQLRKTIGSGIEIRSYSTLPTGSGLGTSSILAGTVIASVSKCIGLEQDDSSLIHTVLKLEQLMTTGGGWQDQVGGLLPGFKLGSCSAGLPLKVSISKVMPVSREFDKLLGDHMKLIFTGRSRLARDLLQSVIRRWYARLPRICATTEALTENAIACSQAYERGDLASIGGCLSKYWSHKKMMAAGCEPEVISKMMRLLEPHVHGQSLCGAGGGGFLSIVTKEPMSCEAVRSVLALGGVDVSDTTFHTVTIASQGMSVTVLPPPE